MAPSATSFLKRLEDAYTRLDGWVSTLGGFGTTKDKRLYTTHQTDLLTDELVESLWVGDDIAARIIEDVPCEALRQGFEINTGDGDKGLSEDLCAKCEELGVLENFMRAKQFARAYGGGAVFPVVNDLQADTALPLNLSAITSVQHLQVFEKRELQAESYYDDPFDKKFGLPKLYRINPRARGGTSGASRHGVLIHESRLIIFQGVLVSRSQNTQSQGWGESYLNRVWSVLRDYNIAWASVGTLLHEYAQAKIRMKGLAELMAANRDDVVRKRLETIALSRSTINGILMDSEESYEREQTPLTGIPDTLDRFGVRIAAAADMPVTRLLGQSPAGLNATGESDTRFFYDRVAVDQTLRTKRQLEQFIKLLLLAKDGPTKGKEPDQWSVKFNPLWQESDKEKADTRSVVASTDKTYWEMGVLSSGQIAKQRFGGDTYSIDTSIDMEEAEALEAEGEATEETGASTVEGLTEETGTAPTNGDQPIQATAMNGAQVASLVNVVTQVNLKEISRASGKAILQVAFQLTAQQAEDVLGPEEFEPPKPEPAPNPFAGGGPPKAEPPAKDDAEDEGESEKPDDEGEAESEDEEVDE